MGIRDSFRKSVRKQVEHVFPVLKKKNKKNGGRK
jgi:hypothetical protein